MIDIDNIDSTILEIVARRFGLCPFPNPTVGESAELWAWRIENMAWSFLVFPATVVNVICAMEMDELYEDPFSAKTDYRNQQVEEENFWREAKRKWKRGEVDGRKRWQ